jgi:hypothetical protein
LDLVFFESVYWVLMEIFVNDEQVCMGSFW